MKNYTVAVCLFFGVLSTHAKATRNAAKECPLFNKSMTLAGKSIHGKSKLTLKLKTDKNGKVTKLNAKDLWFMTDSGPDRVEWRNEVPKDYFRGNCQCLATEFSSPTYACNLTVAYSDEETTALTILFTSADETGVDGGLITEMHTDQGMMNQRRFFEF